MFGFALLGVASTSHELAASKRNETKKASRANSVHRTLAARAIANTAGEPSKTRPGTQEAPSNIWEERRRQLSLLHRLDEKDSANKWPRPLFSKFYSSNCMRKVKTHFLRSTLFLSMVTRKCPCTCSINRQGLPVNFSFLGFLRLNAQKFVAAASSFRKTKKLLL